jgi:hypothetical protein
MKSEGVKDLGAKGSRFFEMASNCRLDTNRR